MAQRYHLFQKHPSETYPIGVDYLSAAPSGAVLVSGVWTATEDDSEVDATSTVIDVAIATIEATIAKVRVQGGVIGKTYRLGLAATFDTGDVLHDNVYMQVIENG